MTHKEKVLALLSDGRPHGHLELYRLGCIAHSRVADLRRDGHNILAWREGDTYFYELRSPHLVGVAQTVERDVANVEAAGSIPAADFAAEALADGTSGCPAALTLFDTERSAA